MKIKKNSRIAWGVTLIVFGVLFLMRAFGLMPDVLVDFRNYPLYAGVIFLIFNKNKNPGIALIAVGILLRLSYELYFVRNITDKMWVRSLWDKGWPLLLIIFGILLIVRVYRSDASKWDE